MEQELLPQIETDERHADIARALNSFSVLTLEQSSQRVQGLGLEPSYAELRFVLVQELANAPPCEVFCASDKDKDTKSGKVGLESTAAVTESNRKAWIEHVQAFQLSQLRVDASKCAVGPLIAHPQTEWIEEFQEQSPRPRT